MFRGGAEEAMACRAPSAQVGHEFARAGQRAHAVALDRGAE